MAERTTSAMIVPQLSSFWPIELQLSGAYRPSIELARPATDACAPAASLFRPPGGQAPPLWIPQLNIYQYFLVIAISTLG